MIVGNITICLPGIHKFTAKKLYHMHVLRKHEQMIKGEESVMKKMVNLHYSDRIIGMHQGSIVFNGKPQELGSDVIEKIYGVPMNELISKVEEVKA